ncbi:hypothetical protein F511_25436 [Dorcoceras hygrometricum]|uniref:Secreted protein n=1 Tax=Dorcoceras hygrometricum TaxID=472368 RepID=A0A2Z7CDM0_9LAMI|nr:hypothetical protein F511_25436 [Dorcoceras hygrometricum]
MIILANRFELLLVVFIVGSTADPDPAPGAQRKFENKLYGNGQYMKIKTKYTKDVSSIYLWRLRARLRLFRFYVAIALQRLNSFNRPIRSTTRISIPSLVCTRKPVKISRMESSRQDDRNEFDGGDVVLATSDDGGGERRRARGMEVVNTT